MSNYQNFAIDFPTRLAQLDQSFRSIADSKELQVTYLLMRLASAFTLPYERVEGDSGTRGLELDLGNPRQIRPLLELDQVFCKTSYCRRPEDWRLLEVENFGVGPERWQAEEREISWVAHWVLGLIRNAVAHSNLFFAATRQIEYVFLGSRKERRPVAERKSARPDLGHYYVIRCPVGALEELVGIWITNLQGLPRVSPDIIWAEIESAA